MQTSLSTFRMVAHNLKITAILKLPKLALCPLSPLRHSLSRGEGQGDILLIVAFVLIY